MKRRSYLGRTTAAAQRAKRQCNQETIEERDERLRKVRDRSSANLIESAYQRTDQCQYIRRRNAVARNNYTAVSEN